jgi:holo-[acyl-carrier protein] synthase
MIAGIGIDAIDIERFAQWHRYDKKTLSRIFSDKELEYILSNPAKSSERFASRFTSKEAFYKALCSYVDSYNQSFSTTCKSVSVTTSKNGAPALIVNWSHLGLKTAQTRLSITHTATTALALVTIIS